MDEFEFIDNTNEARKEFGYGYSVSELVLSEKDIDLLKSGKCLAYSDGEYSTFVSYKNENVGQAKS